MKRSHRIIAFLLAVVLMVGIFPVTILTAAQADTSLRISLSPYNTAEEIDTFIETLSRGAGTLVRMRRH